MKEEKEKTMEYQDGSKSNNYYAGWHTQRTSLSPMPSSQALLKKMIMMTQAEEEEIVAKGGSNFKFEFTFLTFLPGIA